MAMARRRGVLDLALDGAGAGGNADNGGEKPFAVSRPSDYPRIVDFWLFPGGLKDGVFQLSPV